MLGWIPFIGPIIKGITDYLNKKQDVDLEKYKVDGKVDVEAMWAANQLTIAFKDDLGTKICKAPLLFIGSAWCVLTVWDYIVAIKYPGLVWSTRAFPDASGLAYLPQTLLLYFFGSAWLNRKR